MHRRSYCNHAESGVQDLTPGSQPTSPNRSHPARTPSECHPLTSDIPPGRPLVSCHCWKVTAPKSESARHCTGEALGSEEPQVGTKSLGTNREREEEKGRERRGKIHKTLNYKNVSVPVIKVIYSTQLWMQFGSGTGAADLPHSPLLGLMVRRVPWETCFRSPSRSWGFPYLPYVALDCGLPKTPSFYRNKPNPNQ